MKSTSKRIKLDKTKLFGFNQVRTNKDGSKLGMAKPAIGTKTVGTKTV